MKYFVFTILLLCATLSYAQPPAGTYRSRVYGNRQTFYDRSGKQIGSSRQIMPGRTTYYDGKGRTISRSTETPRGTIFQRSRP